MSALRLSHTDRDAGRGEVSRVDLLMMQRALELAAQAAGMDEVPVGAVLYRGEEIIAEAFNVRESSHDPTAHAELIAVRKGGQRLGKWRLSDCSLAVTLEPCPMCAGALVNARVARVIYGAGDPKSGACTTLYRITDDPRLNHSVQVIGGVMQDACAEALKAFFRRRREQNRQRQHSAENEASGTHGAS